MPALPVLQVEVELERHARLELGDSVSRGPRPHVEVVASCSHDDVLAPPERLCEVVDELRFAYLD